MVIVNDAKIILAKNVEKVCDKSVNSRGVVVMVAFLAFFLSFFVCVVRRASRARANLVDCERNENIS